MNAIECIPIEENRAPEMMKHAGIFEASLLNNSESNTPNLITKYVNINSEILFENGTAIIPQHGDSFRLLTLIMRIHDVDGAKNFVKNPTGCLDFVYDTTVLSSVPFHFLFHFDSTNFIVEDKFIVIRFPEFIFNGMKITPKLEQNIKIIAYIDNPHVVVSKLFVEFSYVPGNTLSDPLFILKSKILQTKSCLVKNNLFTYVYNSDPCLMKGMFVKDVRFIKRLLICINNLSRIDYANLMIRALSTKVDSNLYYVPFNNDFSYKNMNFKGSINCQLVGSVKIYIEFNKDIPQPYNFIMYLLCKRSFNIKKNNVVIYNINN